jgi:hypothetical protein
LDPKGLVALWREGLLAQKVLAGQTRGYRHHPQLERFRQCRGLIQAYLAGVYREAGYRGYRFNRKLIDFVVVGTVRPVVTTGQLMFERKWLLRKLSERGGEGRFPLKQTLPMMNEVFWLGSGPVASWERGEL